MINNIKNIGEYVEKAYPDISTLNLMVNEIDEKSIKSILEINVFEDGLQTNTRDFYKDASKDALFFQAGNGFLGGGIRLDFYKESKVKLACEFCEVSHKYEEIKNVIEEFIKQKGSQSFAIIKKDGKMPKELFEGKFLDKMYSTTYKKVSGKHVCHLCGKYEEGFNTTTYKSYTNDKSIYGNVDNKDKAGFIVCFDCLTNVILSRGYIDRYLSIYWMNYNVMFLPHTYNEDVAFFYETSSTNEKGEQTKMLNNIRDNEEGVIESIGKTNSVTDIVFYKEDSKFFYIYHQIQSVLPSRFSLISNSLKKYRIKLFMILNYAAAIKVLLDSVETTDKERIRILDAIFSGRKIDRALFFKRSMDVYKHHYLKDEHKKYNCAWLIGRIYNFLCDCGCMEGEWNVMSTYKNYEELFENNKKYFNTNEKKAWFILGKAYNTMIYYIRDNSKKDEEDVEKTPLEKNFFFARKFDFNDFIYFSNLLEDKAFKYNKSNGYFKKMMCEAKELMAHRENKLSFDEAKYLFFWGIDSYFNNEDVNKESE